MYKYILFYASILIGASSCSTLQSLMLAPSNLETISALKEVLNSSTFKGISKLTALKDDGFVAVLPQEIKPVVSVLKTLGMGDKIDKIDNAIIAASGVALNESQEVLRGAVSELTFTDAVAVVTGGPDAATQVLKGAMYTSVQKRYSEKLDAEFAKVDEMKYWDIAVKSYNLFAKNKINDSLSNILAKKAVDAAFIGIAKEEAIIRENPASLNKAVVTKVFDYYKNQQS